MRKKVEEIEIPRDTEGNPNLDFLKMIIEECLSTNPRAVITARAADKNEESVVKDYLDPNTFAIGSKKTGEGYELKISARV